MQTPKQAAARLRKTITMAQNGGVGLRVDGVERFRVDLPSDLQFKVRATTTGVNVSVDDAGYVNRVTEDNPDNFGGQFRDPIIREVDKLRGAWTPPLPGETKWGLIVIVGTSRYSDTF
jgi:hypothetical protein